MPARAFIAALCGAALFLAASAPLGAEPSPWEGTWSVQGRHSVGGTYTGTLQISRVSGRSYSFSGRMTCADGTTRAYSATAWISPSPGPVQAFRFSYQLPPAGVLEGLSGDRRGPTLTVQGEMRGDRERMESRWWTVGRRDLWGRELLVHRGDASITGVEPGRLDAGTENRSVTILGAGLASRGMPAAASIAFLSGNAPDGRIRVQRVLDAADDGAWLRVSLSVARDAAPGPRAVCVGEAVGRDLLLIDPPVERLRLGGAVQARPGAFYKVLVPDAAGGELSLTGVPVELREKTVDGPVAAGAGGGGVYRIADGRAGWYFVRAAGAGRLSAAFIQKAEVPASRRPWNFWYFPFVERGRGQNLYADGGAYEKFDRVLGLRPDPEGWQRFDRSRHMDRGDFREPSAGAERARYDPSTTRGFAWCYQRSTDEKKSWWGHCWGAVIASSLYRQPKAATLRAADGSSLSFSEEEVEGLLTAFMTNHGVRQTRYVDGCPAGRPTEKTGEPCDGHADDFLLGLQKGILREGLPLASNLRAAATADDQKTEVWNHVVWKYEARFQETEGRDDPTNLEVALTVAATDDVFPSEAWAKREEAYVLRLVYDANGFLQRDHRDQNWVSADHFCPSYLWRIESALPSGTENAVLGRCLERLESAFGLQRLDAR